MDTPSHNYLNNLDTVSIMMIALLLEHGGPINVSGDSLKGAFMMFASKGFCVQTSKEDEEGLSVRLI